MHIEIVNFVFNESTFETKLTTFRIVEIIISITNIYSYFENISTYLRVFESL